MSFDLLKIISDMDWMARGVSLTLLVMGVAALTVFIERTVAYWRSEQQSRALAGVAADLVGRSDYAELTSKLKDFPASHLATVMSGALATYTGALRKLDHAALMELTKRELARQHEDAGIDLRRGLGVLASVGSVAPFVGLLGTVVGIISAFTKISATGSGGLSSVAGGISEALVVTALGLVIAIPAVLLFNRLSARADGLHQRLATAAGQLVDHLEFFTQREKQHGERAA